MITNISNGQVERQVNRIKTIKRKMYGKAGFQLLRKLVLVKSAQFTKSDGKPLLG